jgi:putative nucleotidyltransferase with HDIG domain
MTTESLDRFAGETQERRPLPMRPREAVVVNAVAAGFGVLMLAAAFVLPWNRPFEPLLALAVVVVFGILAGVTFEVGTGFATPDEVMLVAAVFLLPLPLVAPLVAAGYLVSDLRAAVTGKTHVDRLPQAITNAAGALGAAVALALVAPDAHGVSAVGPLALALAAQWLVVSASTLTICRCAHGMSARVAASTMGFVIWIDALLWPFAVLVALGADTFPLAIVAPLPFAWLLRTFSRERSERYAAALELNRAYRGTVAVLADVVETEDSYTAEHSRSVVSLAEAVADELNIPIDDRQELEFAALLHDVGKLAIPREILNKPSSLTAEEFELIKTHTVEGERILARAGGLLARVGAIVRSCHERWDGTGYPDGVLGEEIPLAARIVFCCDAYNAMTTDRPYRRAMSRDTALTEIAGNAGTQFDPRVAEALTTVVLRGGHDGEADRADAVRAMLAAV